MKRLSSQLFSRRQMLMKLSLIGTGATLAACIPSVVVPEARDMTDLRETEIRKGDANMSTFILIHGSWHGGWCWHKVQSLLEKQGHRAIAPDLPGHGRDQMLAGEILLQNYVDRVVEIINSQSEPVILVGHSMGGVVITQVAEAVPDRIKSLVYVAAFLPRNGEALLQLAQQDQESRLLPELTFNQDGGFIELNVEAAAEVFYHDCSETDITYAKAQLVLHEPLAPIGTPMAISAENYGRVPRSYIHCLQDRTLGPSLQQQMFEATPCQQVLPLETSHSPFFAAPKALVNHLLKVADGVLPKEERLGL